MLEGNVNISILLSGVDERSVCNCLLKVPEFLIVLQICINY